MTIICTSYFSSSFFIFDLSFLERILFNQTDILECETREEAGRLLILFLLDIISLGVFVYPLKHSNDS